jgi:hypothetical protein
MQRFRRSYRILTKAGSMVSMALVVFAISCFGQLLWVATWKPGPQQKIAAWQKSPPAATPRQHPLLVWVIFDELSYDQVFEHRAHELELPNFDALRNESATFTNVQPAGYHTKEVIPSLLTGEPVVLTRFDRKNQFFVRYADRKGRFPLDGAGTVFADAQKNGWRTAVVGWYNPYCTTYGDALDSCYFGNRDMIAGPMALGNNFAQNTYVPIKQLYVQLKSPSRSNRQICSYEVRQRLETHMDLEQHWMELLHTDQADFVFLHFSLPHSPNIWSRIHDDYTQKCGSSYLDNLALADHELGKLVGILKSSPRWNDTTLIVEGGVDRRG